MMLSKPAKLKVTQNIEHSHSKQALQAYIGVSHEHTKEHLVSFTFTFVGPTPSKPADTNTDQRPGTQSFRSVHFGQK